MAGQGAAEQAPSRRASLPPMPDRRRVRWLVWRARPRLASRAPSALHVSPRREDAAVARKNDDYYRRPCAHLALAQHRRSPRGQSPLRHIRPKGNKNASPWTPRGGVEQGPRSYLDHAAQAGPGRCEPAVSTRLLVELQHCAA